MIDKISLKFGSSPGEQNLEFDVTPVTIFVGPNYAGKSRALIEIEKYCRNGHGQSNDLILKHLTFAALTRKEIEREIQRIEQVPTRNENLDPGTVILGKINPQDNKAQRVKVHKAGLIAEAQNPNIQQNFYKHFLGLYTLRLDGTNRLNLLNELPGGDLQATPANHLAHLFVDNALRSDVRKVVFDALQKYYVIDPTHMGKLRVRLSDRAPLNEREERGWDSESVLFHSNAVEIKDTSDGVKAFCGIITVVYAGDPKIILIDEPEAFLHPSLSYKLGKALSDFLKDTKKRLFVATHSPSFLMGCVQAHASINIVRLTFKQNVATARILPQDKLLHLMRHPLLRSTDVLGALFYESVIVTEGDADRAFYHEINDRLLSEPGESRGIGNCLFINAQNKQTVWEIVKPLRDLGIPAVGIVDIDMLKEGGEVFSKLLDGAYVPPLNRPTLQTQRADLLRAIDATGRNMKRDGGIDILQGDDKEAAENFFNQLAKYGVFVVQKGELESWLKHLAVPGHGSNWLISIFEKMGEDPTKEGYVKPSHGDVWDFIGKIKAWIDDPQRQGIPR